jgi:integrase/recombinase XerD
MNELAKAFQQWLLEEGRLQKTIESYVGDIKGFQQYLAEKAVNESKPLSRFSFVRYKQYLLDNEFAVSTINKKINSLKVYNDFLQIKGFIDGNYIRLKKDRVQIAAGSEHTVTALSEEQIERLLFYLEDHTKVIIRNKLIAYLLLYTGVREGDTGTGTLSHSSKSSVEIYNLCRAFLFFYLL